MTDMTKLKIAAIKEDKPVTMTIKMPAAIYQDLLAYAEVLKLGSGEAVDPNSLVVPMLARFMATDRAFRRARREVKSDRG